MAAFNNIKKAISKATGMCVFDPNKPITTQGDASGTGLGATLTQNAQPVAFASQIFSKSEQNFCHLEKELLAIAFSMHNFDQYVYGRHA